MVEDNSYPSEGEPQGAPPLPSLAVQVQSPAHLSPLSSLPAVSLVRGLQRPQESWEIKDNGTREAPPFPVDRLRLQISISMGLVAQI